MIEIFVHGRAVPKGSFKAMPGRPRGAPCVKCKRRPRGHPVVVNDNNSTKAWEKAIRGAAMVAMSKSEKLEGAVEVDLTFYMERPKNHHVANDRSRLLKASAPIFHTKRPDIDKLERAVLDGLTGLCFADDCFVAVGGSQKYYTTTQHPQGVRIILRNAEASDDVRRQHEKDIYGVDRGGELVSKSGQGLHQPELFDSKE